jgi:hypothetical protein
MAALFPVVMDLYLVAYRMVMVVSVSGADNANGDGGERECKQNFLHGGFLGRTDLIGGRSAILAEHSDNTVREMQNLTSFLGAPGRSGQLAC